MTTAFEYEIAKIKAATYSINSGLHLINMPAKGPCDLSAYDLRQSERVLRDCADMIAQTRIKLEIKERDEFHQKCKEADARIAQTTPDF